MLLVHCPYCNEDRPEVEFSYAGEAHIARPENADELGDAESARPLRERVERRDQILP